MDLTKPRVVIVGGGFAGIAAARALRRAEANVVVIDKHNHHLFQPLLYQVATAALHPGTIAAPIRSVVSGQKNCRVLMNEVEDVDLEAQTVMLGGEPYTYDYLVVAAGLETNYFGTVRCIQAVLPAMRERGSGTIVNVSSVEGRIAVPDQAPYSASKWAVEGMSEALAHEVRRFGVRVVIVEPGVIMTKIFENSAEATRYDKTSPYKDIMRRNGKMFMAGFRQATQPEEVAAVIRESIETETYRLRWPVGKDAHDMLAGRARISDEDWVMMGDALSDEDYNRLYLERFNIAL